MSQPILAFAHDARDPVRRRPFEAVAVHLRRFRPGAIVRPACLGLEGPTGRASGSGPLQTRGGAVRVVPVFLGAGGPVCRHFPRLLATPSPQLPKVRWSLKQAMGQAQAVSGATARQAAGRAPAP
ncbi:MAG: sirohydrochlorin chelatase [Rubrivivax sp.]|jgi:sirohydrochlorin cobaltochelatase